ncbi:cytochrome P450 [Pyrenochaeta sp. MPI-SDFR-AT-0127]|nr:cytochrome P450 [Pyrenochaeta sp. MPI-SDFR-AT-0127]
MAAANFTDLPVYDDKPSSFAALQRNRCLQALVTALVVCCCTRILSSHWYKSIKYSHGRHVEPPTLPYWIPGLKHAFSMAYDSKAFLAKSLDKYGDGSPFFINAAGEKLLIILDPEHIKNALRSSAELDPNPFIHKKIMGALMGSPQEAIDHYTSDKGNTDYIQTTHIRKHTTGSNLVSLDHRLFSSLKRSIEEVLSPPFDSAWTDISDLYAFVEHHVTRAIAETLLGSAIIESYPGLVSDLWTHIEYTDHFFMGLPRFLMPAAYAARDRLLENIKQYSKISESLHHQGAVHSEWDPVAGSSLLQERERLYSEMPGHDEHGRAAQTLGLIYGGTSLTVPISFWYFFEAIRDRTLHERILAEVANHHDLQSSYEFMKLTTEYCPLLQSMHAETTRYYSSNLTVREVVAGKFALDAKYTIGKGTTVFIPNKFAGQFTPAWALARPKAVNRPLDEFWAERYIVKETGKRERFSDVGLGGNWTSFGGGEHKCPGRHFARNIAIVTLVVLMGEFECDIKDLEGAKKLDPPLKKFAFGTMRPKGKVAARIRRRCR